MALVDDIGRQVRAARLARGMTLREAAPLCGVSYQMLGQIENGQNTTVDTLEKIVRGLGASVTVALAEAETMQTPRPIPADRRAVVERFLSVLPGIPQEEIDVFLHQVAVWERRHGRPDNV